MSSLYPEIEPDAQGMLDVGDGHHVYWETAGNRPASLPWFCDVSGPPDIAWNLAQAWPDSGFVLLDEAGHGSEMTETLIAATDRFAARR